jgi:hypothetical protein
MKTHRRYWVFFLLFLFSGIAYLDRVNMSVAGKPTQERREQVAESDRRKPEFVGNRRKAIHWLMLRLVLTGKRRDLGEEIGAWGASPMPMPRRTISIVAKLPTIPVAICAADHTATAIGAITCVPQRSINLPPGSIIST